MSAPFTQCSHALRFWWFVFAFVFATLLGLLLTTALRTALHFSRPFWIGMLAVCTVLMMMASEAFLALTGATLGGGAAAPGGWLHRVRAATAGAIAAVASLVLLMMAVGTDWEHRAGHGRDDDKPATGFAGHGQGAAPLAVPAQNVRVVETV
ncbi:hypothetical protein HT031_001443 [Scenedesmus sp. PABB004]|nr:hypothetical protein HT031_001443 [Scenedesmus sp. PABB004]